MTGFEVETIAQLLAVALAAEQAAAARYTDISRRMRDSGNENLAELFAGIADSEHEHAEEVEQMIQVLDIKELPQVPAIDWQFFGARDDRDRAIRPTISTPYLALAYAVNSEELAFRYYSHVAASAKNDEVCRFAEIFAKEELSHAALFREQRRLAYHQQQAQAKQNAIPEAADIHTLADLLAAASRIEGRINWLLSAAQDRGMDVAGEVANGVAFVDNLEQEMGALHQELRSARACAPVNAFEDFAPSGITEILREIFQAAEQAFIFYDSITETSRNETVERKAQELARRSLDRIDALGTLLEN